MTRRIRPARGFTLVEVLIVLTLVGTAVGFSIEGYRSYRDGLRARTAAEQVLDTLASARALARESGRETRVDFAPDPTAAAGSSFASWIEPAETTREPSPAPRSELARFELPSEIYFGRPEGIELGPLGTATASDGVTFADDIAAFRPDGTASEAGHVTVLDPVGRTWAVTLSRAGDLRLYRLYKGTWQ